jgi:hypothetical protein
VSEVQQERGVGLLDRIVGSTQTAAYLRWDEVLRADPCAYCGQPGGTIDHIVPRSQDGADTHDNLTGACRSCNISKSSLSLLFFLLWRASGPKVPPGPSRYGAHRLAHREGQKLRQKDAAERMRRAMAEQGYGPLVRI